MNSGGYQMLVRGVSSSCVVDYYSSSCSTTAASQVLEASDGNRAFPVHYHMDYFNRISHPVLILTSVAKRSVLNKTRIPLWLVKGSFGADGCV